MRKYLFFDIATLFLTPDQDSARRALLIADIIFAVQKPKNDYFIDFKNYCFKFVFHKFKENLSGFNENLNLYLTIF